jgi:hypothetical protein
MKREHVMVWLLPAAVLLACGAAQGKDYDWVVKGQVLVKHE